MENKLLEIISEEELIQLVSKEGLTFRAIAKRYNLSPITVSELP